MIGTRLKSGELHQANHNLDETGLPEEAELRILNTKDHSMVRSPPH